MILDLVPKLQLGNPPSESLAPRQTKRSFAEMRSQAGAWDRGTARQQRSARVSRPRRKRCVGECRRRGFAWFPSSSLGTRQARVLLHGKRSGASRKCGPKLELGTETSVGDGGVARPAPNAGSRCQPRFGFAQPGPTGLPLGNPQTLPANPQLTPLSWLS